MNAAYDPPFGCFTFTHCPTCDVMCVICACVMCVMCACVMWVVGVGWGGRTSQGVIVGVGVVGLGVVCGGALALALALTTVGGGVFFFARDAFFFAGGAFFFAGDAFFFRVRRREGVFLARDVFFFLAGGAFSAGGAFFFFESPLPC